jgi:hypothetical protein
LYWLRTGKKPLKGLMISRFRYAKPRDNQPALTRN